MEMHHLGCIICCQIRLRTGASLKGTRLAQMNTSAWRGEKLISSIPNRARSYLPAAVAMNSMAQQAVPKGIGQRELALDQLTQLFRNSNRVVVHGSPPWKTCCASARWLNPIAVLPSSRRR